MKSLRHLVTFTAVFILLSVPALESRAQDTGTTKVLVLGDSIMRAVSHSMERKLEARDDYEATSFTSLGSGLARLDAFDWMSKVKQLMQDEKPDIVVMMIGTNDKQAMRLNGKVFQPGSEEWEDEYRRRVGQCMDLMVDGNARQIMWIELPDMREKKLQKDATEINEIIQEETAKRDTISFFETRNFLSREPGTFSPYVFDSNGMPLKVRDGDGVHLSRNGADLLADKLIEAF